MFSENEDKARLVRQMTQEAINLAMEGKWDEAVSVNLNIIENVPNDVDAYNRLGKAYMELGDLDKANEAYQKVLELDSDNPIASKNLNRIAQLRAANLKLREEKRKVKVPLHQFVGEAGKSGVVSLYNLAPSEVIARMTAGDKVNLKIVGQQLFVESEDGELLGQVEPQHGPRIAKLMEGGNKYTAAIVSIEGDKVKVIIKETYQHPTQRGKVSFPPKPVEGFQPHIRDTLLRRRGIEEEEFLEEEEAEYAGEEISELLPEGFSILEENIPVADLEDEDLIEEE